ncbi:MAG: nucleotidyl transferase AbiEii/AbiGii toxin family protein [Betaproteobacteria bacterium]|nr:nucleotidyl transferase AbiEii/AbiGii toxin family protein [Betaproteobacteria bacterium]
MAQDRLKTWETLFRQALRVIDSVETDMLGPHDWSFGGGTVLMRKYRHRYSKDIDIFVPDPQYLGHLSPRLNDTVDGLTSRYVEQTEFLKLYFPEGEIDFIASLSLTATPHRVETVLGREVQVQTPVEIVARKIQYRGAEFTARDIFDFALLIEKEPAAVASIAPILRRQRDSILARLQRSDAILRRTFAELEVLDFKPSYEQCVQAVRDALTSA